MNMLTWPIEALHQRRWARQWEAFEVFLPAGTRPSGDQLGEALLTLWGRMVRSQMWELIKGAPRIIFRVTAAPKEIHYYWLIPSQFSTLMARVLSDAYPRGALAEVVDPGEPPLAGKCSVAAELHLSKGPAFSLHPFAHAHATALRKAVSGLAGDDRVCVDYILCAARDRDWKPGAYEEYRRQILPGQNGGEASLGQQIISGLDRIMLGSNPPGSSTTNGRPQRADGVKRESVAETPKALVSDHGFYVSGRIHVSAADRERANGILADLTATWVHLDAGNSLRPVRAPLRAGHIRRGMCQRIAPLTERKVLVTADVASLVNVAPAPSAEGAARVIEMRWAPPPEQPGSIHFLDVQFRGRRVPVYVPPKTLCDHFAIMGMTGAGKGVLLLRLCYNLAAAGHGFISLWPFKKDARALLAGLPENRLGDVVYFEVGHDNWALPANLVAHDGTVKDLHAAVQEALNISFRLWSDSWGRSMQRYLQMAFYGAGALRGSLPEMIAILTDEEVRQEAADLLPAGDLVLQEVARFLREDEFDPRQIDPALNKLQELQLMPAIAPMVTQVNAVPWRDWAAQKKIVIGVLNQEDHGDLPVAVAAATIVSQAHRALMKTPVDQRVLYPMIYDEFYTVAGRGGETWEKAFKQLRQFMIPQIAACQDKKQFKGVTVGAFNALSGAGNFVVLANTSEHSDDAVQFIGKGGPTPDDIVQLSKRTAYCNLTLNDQRTGIVSCWAPEVGGNPYLPQLRDPDTLMERSMAKYLTRIDGGGNLTIGQAPAAPGRPGMIVG